MRYVLPLVVLCSLAIGLPASAITLVKNSQTRHVIVLSEQASPSERHSAEELQRFVEEMSGAVLPIVSGDVGRYKRTIVIGEGPAQKTLAPDIDFSSLGDEGFTVRTVGENIVIAGSRLRGSMYGVYYLLDVLGCRWYTSFVSKIPKRSALRVPVLNVKSVPDFEYRDAFYRDSFNGDWAARNGNNGASVITDESRGGVMGYNGFCHTFDGLMPTDQYFKDHPEYYSLVDGVRISARNEWQLCLTNPDVQRIVTQTVLDRIKGNPGPLIVSVTQNDNGNYCRCPNCAAVDAEEGSPSGLMLRFVNSVADEVAKVYPKHIIDTFAYQYTEKPPKITKPRPNVVVRLCPIDACEHHPYETCPKNAGFLKNLQGWHAISNRLYIWHYNTNFANYLQPLLDLEQFPDSIHLYKRLGVQGIMFQGTYNAGNGPYGCAGWMDNLKAWIMVKMLWNVNADPIALRNEFLNGFFGKSAKPIGEYVQLLLDEVRVNNIHGYIYDNPTDIKYLSSDVLAKCNKLFDQAEKLADNPEVLKRVKHARLSIRYVELCRQMNAAKSQATDMKKDLIAKLEQFVRDCEADGIINVSEGNVIRPWLAYETAELMK